MKISIKSPTRVDLAGGTLDCWPLYCLVDDCYTVNLSIDIFTYVDLEPHAGPELHVHLKDLDYKRTFSNLAECLACPDLQLDLLRHLFTALNPKTGFSLSTKSDSPVGGGLGGSSSLLISLIKAFSQWQKTSFSVYEMVTLASNIEAKVLKKPTGTQDYFPAIQEGLNLIHYTSFGPQVELLPFPLEFFQQRMFLVYTGQPHHSGINNWQVIKKAMDRDPRTFESLNQIKAISSKLVDFIRDGQWEALVEIFRLEFSARLALAESFTSPEIEKLEQIVMDAGGSAVKICGAGGGGCVMVWTEPANKEKVIRACEKEKFQVLRASPVPAS